MPQISRGKLIAGHGDGCGAGDGYGDGYGEGFGTGSIMFPIFAVLDAANK